ncbi:helix-turn-helix domain-containing protein [Methylophilus methylotrophus]|jgi:transcriptional regulator with XRE-family HTH domain|uniref:helix-turn-helix domain-containing protein n=1 Tax=Methylophilus methylotrophus TaxID=17 RepID=UPI000F5B6968|nr:helix-turn-helix transcriptional regulator [Methylophilus methylotrophus]
MSNQEEMSLSLPDRIRIERKRMGLLQGEFAKLGGVSITSQSFYETGKTWPTMEYLENLRANGVDVRFIASGLRAVNTTVDWLILKNAYLMVQHSFVDRGDVEYSPEQLFDAFKTVAEAALGIARPDLIADKVSKKGLVNENEHSG